MRHQPQHEHNVWIKMPGEIMDKILDHLSADCLFELRKVDKKFKAHSQQNFIKRDSNFCKVSCIRNALWEKLKESEKFGRIQNSLFLTKWMLYKLIEWYFAIPESTPKEIRQNWGAKYYPELINQDGKLDKKFAELGYEGHIDIGIQLQVEKTLYKWENR